MVLDHTGVRASDRRVSERDGAIPWIRKCAEVGMVETVRRQPVLDEAAGRYVVIEDGATAVLDFKLSDGRLSIEHVVVPDAISGRGIGGELVASAVARANDEHRTVAPRCPFARRWLRRNPDVAVATSIDWEATPHP
jgi:predicted GNAT family acetyltransferase